MARDLKAKIRLDADTKNANRNLKQTTAQLGLLGTATRAVSKGLAGLKAAFAGAAIPGLALVAVFSKIISLANEEEDAIQKLNASIGNLNGERQALSNALQKNADALAAVTTAGNEEILGVQAQIAIFIKDEEQIKALTLASLNFAAAQGIDAVSAAQLLTKTVASSTNSLTRYGLEVEGAVGSTERFNSAIEALSKFQGQAGSAAETTSGKIGLLADSFTDFLEQIGLVVTGLESTSSVLGFLTDVFNRAGAGIKFLSTQLTGLAQVASVIAESILPDFIGKMIGVEGATLRAVQAQEKNRAALGKQQTALRGAEKATKALEEATKASNDELQATEKAVDAAADALRKLGIVLDEDVNQKLAANEKLLDAVEARYRDNGSREEYERSLKGIAADNQKLTDSLREQVDVFGNTTQATDIYSSSLQGARLQLRELGQEDIRFTETVVSGSARRATARLAESNAGTQTIFGQQTTQGGTFFIPDTVVAGANGRVEVARHIGPSGRGVSII